MAKLVFDIPDVTVNKDDFFKDGVFQHMGLIPIDHQRIKDIIQSNVLIDKHTKQVIFTVVHIILTSMNEMGFYKWLPDLLKSVFTPVFSIKLMQDETLLKLLKEKK